MYDVVHFLMFKGFVPHDALHVEYLTADGEDSLILTAAPLFGRAAGRITLDDEQFAVGCILVRTVGQLARHATARHRTLALYAFTGLAGSHTCCRSQDDFVHNQFGFFRMLLQIIA